MRLWTIPVGYLRVNCYLFADAAGSDAVVIDPGDGAEAILARVKDERLNVRAILLTHCHWDHIGAVADVAEATGAPVMLHRADLPWLREGSPRPVEPSRFLDHGDTVTAGTLHLEAIHTPGHSPGGLCYRAADRIFTGDTLFAGSVGRWDLPGGSREELFRSLRERLLTLPDDLPVFPGHGGPTTIGAERRSPLFEGLS